MARMQNLVPCLWFDTQAEDAAKFYVSIFEDSKIESVNYYGKEGHEIHGRPEGMVLTVAFRLQGHPMVALNGGPQFNFTEAVSFQIMCDSQEEVDYFWAKLTADGGSPGHCGWLKDRFGLSWQVVPAAAIQMLQDPDSTKTERLTRALLRMRKLDLADLERAFHGKSAA